MITCPACQRAPLAEPGERCSGVRGGVRCHAVRCACKALVRGRLVCPECDQVVPLDLVRLDVSFEADEGPRGARRAAATLPIVVDRVSGSIWADCRLWPRLQHDRGRPNASAVLAAAKAEVPGRRELVGRCHVAAPEGARPVCRCSPKFWPRSPAPVFARTRVLGRSSPTVVEVVLVIEPSPFVLDAPPFTAAIETRKLVLCLVEARRLGSAADELVRHLEEALLGGLWIDGGFPLDMPAGDAAAVELALERRRGELGGDERWPSWPLATLEGRYFCGGATCPGLVAAAGMLAPHPLSCLGDVADTPEARRVLHVNLGHRPPRRSHV